MNQKSTLGKLSVHFWPLFSALGRSGDAPGSISKPPGSILEPPGSILEPPGPDFGPISPVWATSAHPPNSKKGTEIPLFSVEFSWILEPPVSAQLGIGSVTKWCTVGQFVHLRQMTRQMTLTNGRACHTHGATPIQRGGLGGAH